MTNKHSLDAKQINNKHKYKILLRINTLKAYKSTLIFNVVECRKITTV